MRPVAQSASAVPSRSAVRTRARVRAGSGSVMVFRCPCGSGAPSTPACRAASARPAPRHARDRRGSPCAQPRTSRLRPGAKAYTLTGASSTARESSNTSSSGVGVPARTAAGTATLSVRASASSPGSGTRSTTSCPARRARYTRFTMPTLGRRVRGPSSANCHAKADSSAGVRSGRGGTPAVCRTGCVARRNRALVQCARLWQTGRCPAFQVRQAAGEVGHPVPRGVGISGIHPVTAFRPALSGGARPTEHGVPEIREARQGQPVPRTGAFQAVLARRDDPGI